MILPYSFVFIIFCVLSTVFSGYRSEYKNTSSEKRTILWLFYGVSFFLTDIAGNILTKIKRPNSSEPFSSTKKKVAMLNPGGNILQNTYLLLAKRISLCIVIVMVFMLLGIFYSLNGLLNPAENVETLKRPDDGSEYITYSLQVRTEDSTEYIDLEVSRKIYEYNEVIALFDEHREEVLSLMLGENESPDRITMPLSFPSSVGDPGISLSWQPEDPSYIDYNGNLLYENISAEGTHTSVYVSMEMEDITATLMIGVTLYPNGNTALSSLKSEIEQYIADNSSPNSDIISLPSEIRGSSITFFFPTESQDTAFLLLALLSAIVLYIVLSRETDAKLKARNEQMMQDYPEIVSKLLLLSGAGLNIQNAMKKIVNDYKNAPHFKSRYAYEELSITVNSLQNGKPEASAYSELGKRCGLMPYIKLGALLEQNLQKGAKELRYHLNNEVRCAFENHRQAALTRSKQAETKLIIPMIMILIVIMVLIMVPSFMNI